MIAEIVGLGYRAYVAIAGCAIPFTGYRAALRSYAFVDERRRYRWRNYRSGLAARSRRRLRELAQRQADHVAELERSAAGEDSPGSAALVAELRTADLDLEETSVSARPTSRCS